MRTKTDFATQETELIIERREAQCLADAEQIASAIGKLGNAVLATKANATVEQLRVLNGMITPYVAKKRETAAAT